MLGFILLLVAVVFAHAASAGVLFQQYLHYEVVEGDSLISIGARLGVDWKEVTHDNKLGDARAIRPGMKLRIRVQEIIPETTETGIIIDIPGRMLYFFDSSVPMMVVPAGLGMAQTDGKRGWETPEGKFTVKGKLKNPDWKVPRSIQEELRREGLAVKESYPPGPKNPVGGLVLQTTLPGILIHETIDPPSVYGFVSHGCVRLLRKDMEQLFGSISSGMSGKILYRPIKVAQLADGRVFMEANEDVYGKTADMQETARKVLSEAGLLSQVDLSKVGKVVQAKAGIPVDVTANKP